MIAEEPYYRSFVRATAPRAIVRVYIHSLQTVRVLQQGGQLQVVLITYSNRVVGVWAIAVNSFKKLQQMF